MFFFGSFYYGDYIWFLGAILACGILSAVASAKVHRSYSKYAGVKCSSGLTGYSAVRRIMRSHYIDDIEIGCVKGTLSDHYHPKKKIVNLSESTYNSSSISAVAVAAHEMGHVMQKKEGWFFYKLRTALVPVTNFGSFLAMPLVLVGLMLDLIMAGAEAGGSDIGFYVALIGVALYGTSFLFTLITLPVELNASRRAKRMLVDEGIIREDEMPAAAEVLSAAALTYLASMLTSLVYFLRFLFYVLAIFGRRGNSRR